MPHSHRISDQVEAMNQDIIKRILADTNKSVPAQQRQLAKDFISEYYQITPTKDLQQRTPAELRSIALTHWQLGHTRKAGSILLRVYNPQPETHGWQSVHTIIETVLDDRPFLLDSMRSAATRLGLTVHLTIHPVLHIGSNKAGEVTAVSKQPTKSSNPVAYIQLHVDKRSNKDELDALQREFSAVIADIIAVTEGWDSMVKFSHETIANLSAFTKGHTGIQEAASFLQWLADGHFTFLGCCEFLPEGKSFKVKSSSSLGLLKSKRKGGAVKAQDLVPINTHEFINSQKAILITKSNHRSTVHRDTKLDLITVSVYDKSGNIASKRCFLGLLTSSSYRRLTSDIPMLSARTARVISNAGLPDNSHDQKILCDILETFPRDLMMQSNTDELSRIATGILGLQERQRVRLFGQRDHYGRFYNCLVYIPRDKYGRELRLAVQDALSQELHGVEVEFDTLFSSNSALARINYVIWSDPAHDTQAVDWDALEKKIINIAHGWDEQLSDAVRDHFGDEKGNMLLRKYDNAFASGYKASYPASNAAWDISRMEDIRTDSDIGMRFFRPPMADEALVHFKLYTLGVPVILSDVLPILENMGLCVEGENPHFIKTSTGESYWLHEFILRARDGSTIDPEASDERFMACFKGVWHGTIENDNFNRLVLGAGVSWRDTVVMRAFCKYMLQIRLPFSEGYISDSLCNNPEIAHTLIALFQARFDPAVSSKSNKQTESLQEKLDAQLEKVTSLDQDRILRSFQNLIKATLRTNHYQHNSTGEYKEYLSFKLDTSSIDSIPLPRPKYEIFVCSPRMEGVHLRGGSVARGGLRWSDRREDFRTEVLGLVKAQMVKNAVIVPVGSKGGFILKRPPPTSDREAYMAEGIACYKTFLRGLLDITDNLLEGEVTPPKEVVRYDGDDPYLVVAADKGTATFSDFANSVSAEYSFWLGDAFASGGSNGYDHKGMGITARGAWESVKRHFRTMDIDIQSSDFSVVGVGDMAGDVFGNGMLLSEHIQLVAAFNHMHIFIDPTPDTASSFAERQRLFNLPRSSWSDYNTKLLSKGGAIFERSAKSIKLTPEIKRALDVNTDTLTPNALINAILKAPVDLFWNGGIGTYIKASSETHADISDRANDSLRVNGNELRCRVIGEGGNLGASQLGRIEFAKLGGKHNYTDAIDNAAGVDCSDHEVNIKILLDQVVAQGELTEKQRNATLESMTEEVGLLVLQDNYQQTQCISVCHTESASLLDEHARFMHYLESANLLNRELEHLPDNKKITACLASGNTGLTQPELAVLVSYSKMTFYDQFLASDVPDDPWLEQVLCEYFPTALSKSYPEQMQAHRLRREIIATVLTNELVNRMGPSFAFRIMDETGATVAELATAFIISKELFDMPEIWAQIEELDNKVSAQTQIDLLILVRGLLERSIHWLIRSRRACQPIDNTILLYRRDIVSLSKSLPDPMTENDRESLSAHVQSLTEQGVPEKLALAVSNTGPLSSAFDISEVAHNGKAEMEMVANIYFEVGAILNLQWLIDEISSLPVSNRWHTLAKSRLRADLHNQQRKLTAEVLNSKTGSANAKTRLKHWSATGEADQAAYHGLIAEIKTAGATDFAMLSVAVNEVHKLLQTADAID